MEVFVGVGLLSALGYAAYRATAARQRTVAAHRTAEAQLAAARRRRDVELARQRQEQMRLRHQQSVVSRRLQQALLQVHESPDFRRAASFAAQARGLPVEFRQRQFRRFRQTLVQHFSRRLAAGEDSERLVESLSPLVQALGVSTFEADYIRVEAEGMRRAPQRREPTYAEHLDLLRRQHEDRLAALRSLPGVDAETREQLLEAETMRFRDELLRLGQEAQPPI